ncbi:MAG: YggS family pyridoxal phosphate-dependent enzyme [Rickettsiales bacterium]
MNADLTANYRAVLARLRAAVPDGPLPRLIAVSKKRPEADVRALIACGCEDFGENTVQEITEKWEAIKRDFPLVRLHFIGRLQRNKAAEAWKRCDAIHSVDRAPLVDALASAKRRFGGDVPCFVQVNIGDEAQKGGVSPGEAIGLANYAASQGVRVVGLMGVPPEGADPAPYFSRLRQLNAAAGLPRLSMGMSNDFECAARLGATDVRVGGLIFENRAR